MTCKYYYTQIGNAFSVGLGDDNEIVKFWFDVEGESKSPLTKEDAEHLAREMVDTLNEHYPVTEDVAEKFGDTEEFFEMKKFLESDDVDDDLKKMMLKLALIKMMTSLE